MTIKSSEYLTTMERDRTIIKNQKIKIRNNLSKDIK